MREEDEVQWESAVMLLTKGDEIHVRSSENLTAEQMLSILASATVALNKVLSGLDAKDSPTMH